MRGAPGAGAKWSWEIAYGPQAERGSGSGFRSTPKTPKRGQRLVRGCGLGGRLRAAAPGAKDWGRRDVMTAICFILIFLAAMGLLNLVEFGRLD